MRGREPPLTRDLPIKFDSLLPVAAVRFREGWRSINRRSVSVFMAHGRQVARGTARHACADDHLRATTGSRKLAMVEAGL